MKLMLYSYWRSSCSWRVRLALHLKNLAFDYRAVHLAENEQERHAFRMISPLGQVPTLVVVGDDGRKQALTQSLAIVRWLENAFPDPRLVPSKIWDRARMWELAEIVNAGTQPHQNLRVIRELTKQGVDAKRWGRHAIERGLAAYAKALKGLTGRYSVGDTVTVADLCLVPQLYNARRFDVDLRAYPRLLEIESATTDEAAFRLAHPDVQPDAEPASDTR